MLAAALIITDEPLLLTMPCVESLNSDIPPAPARRREGLEGIRVTLGKSRQSVKIRSLQR